LLFFAPLIHAFPFLSSLLFFLSCESLTFIHILPFLFSFYCPSVSLCTKFYTSPIPPSFSYPSVSLYTVIAFLVFHYILHNLYSSLLPFSFCSFILFPFILPSFTMCSEHNLFSSLLFILQFLDPLSSYLTHLSLHLIYESFLIPSFVLLLSSHSDNFPFPLHSLLSLFPSLVFLVALSFNFHSSYFPSPLPIFNSVFFSSSLCFFIFCALMFFIYSTSFPFLIP